MKRFFYTLLLSVIGTCSIQAQKQLVFTPTWTAQAQFAGFYVADALGFFRDEGLDVIIKHPSASNTSLNRLKSGESHYVALHLVSALDMIDKGDELINVMQCFQQSGEMIVSHKPLRGLKSLDRKRVGCFKSGISKLPIALARREKVNIEWIPFISHTNLYVSGAIDATLAMNYNEYYQLIMAGQRLNRNQIIYMRDIGCNVPEDGVYVTREYFTKHKAEVDKFVKASKRGWEYAISHPKETLDIVMLYMRQAGISGNEDAQKWMLKECLRLLVSPRTGKRTYKLEPEGLNQANSILLQGGEITKPITYKQITEP